MGVKFPHIFCFLKNILYICNMTLKHIFRNINWLRVSMIFLIINIFYVWSTKDIKDFNLVLINVLLIFYFILGWWRIEIIEKYKK